MKKLACLLAVLSLLAGACSRSYPTLAAAIYDGDRSAVVEMLAQPGVALQEVTKYHGRSVKVVDQGLSIAIVQGELPIIRVLLEHVTDVNTPYPRGSGDLTFSFLHLAVYPGHPGLRFDDDEAVAQYVETIRVLLDAGASVGNSLSHACRLRSTKHEDPKWDTRSRYALLEIIELMSPHADFAARESGRTALRFAVGAGDLPVAQILIAHGADVNEVPSAKRKPLLELARSNGHDEMVTLLLQHGATDR